MGHRVPNTPVAPEAGSAVARVTDSWPGRSGCVPDRTRRRPAGAAWRGSPAGARSSGSRSLAPLPDMNPGEVVGTEPQRAAGQPARHLRLQLLPAVDEGAVGGVRVLDPRDAVVVHPD